MKSSNHGLRLMIAKTAKEINDIIALDSVRRGEKNDEIRKDLLPDRTRTRLVFVLEELQAILK